MRITNNITTQSALRGLQRGQRDVAAASERVTTGLRFHRASEDPMAAAQVMRTGSSLRALEQYRRNMDAAAARTATEERVLDQLTSALTRALELGISQASTTANAATRATAKAEVDQLLELAVSLGNTRFLDGPLFGGVEGALPFAVDRSDPSALDFTTTSPTGHHQVEIAAGQFMVTNHHGGEIFGTQSSGALAALRDLARALGQNDETAIRGVLGDVRSAVDRTQELTGDIGVRSNRLEVAGANLAALETTLTTFKADLQEVDFEKAVTELVGRQTAFQAAMLATSRVMGMTLTDYLR